MCMLLPDALDDDPQTCQVQTSIIALFLIQVNDKADGLRTVIR